MAQGHQILLPPLVRVGGGGGGGGRGRGDGETNIIDYMLDFHLTDSQKCYSGTPRWQTPFGPSIIIEYNIILHYCNDFAGFKIARNQEFSKVLSNSEQALLEPST